ncbi:MAG: hypothetical protein ACQEQL_04390 [Pseudomonadota bacterium]
MREPLDLIIKTVSIFFMKFVDAYITDRFNPSAIPPQIKQAGRFLSARLRFGQAVASYLDNDNLTRHMQAIPANGNRVALQQDGSVFSTSAKSSFARALTQTPVLSRFYRPGMQTQPKPRAPKMVSIPGMAK